MHGRNLSTVITLVCVVCWRHVALRLQRCHEVLIRACAERGQQIAMLVARSRAKVMAASGQVSGGSFKQGGASGADYETTSTENTGDRDSGNLSGH